MHLNLTYSHNFNQSVKISIKGGDERHALREEDMYQIKKKLSKMKHHCNQKQNYKKQNGACTASLKK